MDRADNKQEAVQSLIHERFDLANKNTQDIPVPTTEPASTNGYHTPSSKPTPSQSSPGISTPASVKDESEDEESDVISEPPKKKRKSAAAKKEVDDAKLAAMLQAQENSRARSTRGGVNKKATPKKRKPKKKSEKKVKADDDSDLELNSDGEVKEKPKKGGFHVSLFWIWRGWDADEDRNNITFQRRWRI